MPYLTKMTVTAKNMNGDTFVHPEGSVLSDWELSDVIRQKISEGSDWYRERFEAITDTEAHHYRVEATKADGIRTIDGKEVAPPFDDYVGLHPAEIIERMKQCKPDKAQQIRLYEQAGMNRNQITSYVVPAEREPFANYDQMGLNEILEKFSIISDVAVAEAKMYEANHRGRPIILEYDRAIYEQQPPAPDPTQGLQPEPQPTAPTAPLTPAPPVATEGSTPGTDQLAAQQQTAVAPAPPASLQPIAAPPGA